MYILILTANNQAIGASDTSEITMNELGNDLNFGGRWYALLKKEDVFTVEVPNDFDYKDGCFAYDPETETIIDISAF